MVSRRKQLIFALVPVTILIGLLTAAELALRIFAPSLASPLVTEVDTPVGKRYQFNRRALERYFPADAVLIPELKPSLMSVRKDSTIFRVFCLGESSMFGTPYEMTANIPGIVRKQLRRRVTDRDVEVINLGASAINTNVIRDLSRELVRFSPDLVLLYTGHNEFYGPDGAGASFLERKFPSLTQLKYSLRDLRLVRAFQSLMHRLLRSPAGNERNMMREVSRGARVPSGSADAERVYGNFRRNMEDILKTFQEAHIPVIVSDVSANRLFPPFDYDRREGQEKIVPMFESRRFQELLPLLQRFASEDSANAFVSYWLGRTLLATGDAAGARRWLDRALDDDLLKFRAPERINRITREVSEERGIPCVSADSLFAAASPENIPGPDLFWEHLHPRARGYFLIADLFAAEIVRRHLSPGPDVSYTATRIPFQTDSLSICWLDQAYADLSITALTSRWPFDNYRAELAVVPAADSALRQVAVDTYNRRLAWDEACYQCVTLFQNRRNFREAETTLEALLEENPANFYARYRLGNLFRDAGDLPRAVEAYRAAIRSNPEYPFARIDLGLLEINDGNFDEAILQLAVAERLLTGPAPASARATIYYGLSAAYANKGEKSRALEYIARSLQLAPSYPAARALERSLAGTR